jgi:hypothetical protein
MTAAQLDEFVSARVPTVLTADEVLTRLGEVPATPPDCDGNTAAILEHMRAIRAAVPQVVASAGTGDRIVAELQARAPEALTARRGRGAAASALTALATRCTEMTTVLATAAADYDCHHLVTTLMIHRKCFPERCYKHGRRAGTSALPDTRECRCCHTMRLRTPTCVAAAAAVAVAIVLPLQGLRTAASTAFHTRCAPRRTSTTMATSSTAALM